MNTYVSAPAPPPPSTGTTAGAVAGAGAGDGTTSSTARAGAGAGAGVSSSGAGAGAGVSSSTAAAINSKALDLLKRRYRLPESLIRHALPNPLMQISGDKMTAAVACTADARRLNDLCLELATQELNVLYADYTPISSVARSDSLFKKPRVGSVLFNNSVASEKRRSSKVLKDLHDRFEKATKELKAQEGKEKRRMLTQMRIDFAGQAELMRCRLEILEDMKEKALDNLLYLLLDWNARLDDLAEATWIMQHYRPLDLKCIMPVPGSNELSTCGIKSVRKAILKRLDCRLTAIDIFKARRLVLGVFGRIHLETMLEQSIQHAKSALKTYMTALDDMLIYEVMAIASIKDQQKSITRLAQKRTLIGRYPVYLLGDAEEAESNTVYIVDYDDEEEEECDYYINFEKLGVESPITDSSELDSDAEVEDELNEVDAEVEDEVESEYKEGAHANEDGPKQEEKFGFIKFHWNFGADPSDEVKRYKKYLSFLEYC